MFESVRESQNVQKWKVRFSELACVDATEPYRDEKWESSKSTAHLHGSLVLWDSVIISLLAFVKVGVDENLGQTLEVRDRTTFNEQENDIFYALSRTSILPVD